MLLLKMGPEVPSRAPRALPALRRSKKEGGRRPPELVCVIKATWLILFYKKIICNTTILYYTIVKCTIQLYIN